MLFRRRGVFFVRKKPVLIFPASSHRWNILLKALEDKVVLKRLIDVRWSAHVDAVNALDGGYNKIQSALDVIANDEEEDLKTAIEAKSLSSKMDKLEYVILTSVWNRILSRFKIVSKTLQAEDINLSDIVSLMNSMKIFVQSLRGDFNDCLEKAKEKRPQAEYSFVNQRAKKRSVRGSRNDGPSADTVLTGDSKVEIFYPIPDSLTMRVYLRVPLLMSVLTTVFFFSYN